MPNSKFTYTPTTGLQSSVVREEHIEYGFIGTLQRLKYEYRQDPQERPSSESFSVRKDSEIENLEGKIEK